MNKIKSQKGESLSEVLVAMLVSVLGMVLLASMITASVNIIQKSKTKMNEYEQAQNVIVQQTGDGTSGEVTIPSGLFSNIEKKISVKYFVNETLKTNVYSYRKDSN